MYLNTAVQSPVPGSGLAGFIGGRRLANLPTIAHSPRGKVVVMRRGMSGVVQHNFHGIMVPYNTVDVEMRTVADSWKKARGNGTGYADMSVQRAPGNCQDLINVAGDHCGLAPEACEGFNVPAIAADLCADYGAWFNATFPKGPGDAYNYDDATYLAKFGAAALAERRAGSVGVVNPGGTGNSYPGGQVFYNQQGGTIAPTNKTPVVSYGPPSPASILTPPVVVPQSSSPPVPQSASAPAPNSTTAPAPAGSSLLTGSFDVFGQSVPIWALGVVAAGAVWMLSRR